MNFNDLRSAAQRAQTEMDAISQSVDGAKLPLVAAANQRLAEAVAFMEIAAGVRESLDSRLARLDAVCRETVNMVSEVVSRAGFENPEGISPEQIDDFLDQQELASQAIEQARVAITGTLVHLDTALRLSKSA